MSLLTRFKTLRGLRAAAEPELPEVARTVAIIMDGNGRWARRRGLPVAAGHRAGTRALRRTVEAARRIAAEGVPPREIDENTVAQFLFAPELPDPDLLIRTSGEIRISNFLLWQLAYAELVFVDTFWPDFGARELYAALAEYAKRRRRFGGR